VIHRSYRRKESLLRRLEIRWVFIVVQLLLIKVIQQHQPVANMEGLAVMNLTSLDISQASSMLPMILSPNQVLRNQRVKRKLLRRLNKRRRVLRRRRKRRRARKRIVIVRTQVMIQTLLIVQMSLTLIKKIRKKVKQRKKEQV
jgi:hypothetical protein